MDDQLGAVIDRHRGFWRREGESALLSVAEHRPLEDRGGLPLADGSRTGEGYEITPEQMVPEAFYKGAPPSLVVNGDFIRAEAPPHLCWTEAAVGCPIRVATGGPWAEPSDVEPGDLVTHEADAEWVDLLGSFTAFVVQRSAGRYPITQPLMRGPVDMLMSAVGHEPGCLLLVEAPGLAEGILDRCADIFIEMANRRLGETPPFHDGYLSSFGIWAPGTVVRTQLDNATMLSPKTYRDHVREHDRKVIEAFDYSVMHVHSGCLHIADELADIEALTCIQVSIDYPGGPLATEVLPILSSILQRKSLIVSGPVSEEEREMLESLKPSGGLCLQLRVVPEDDWLSEGLEHPPGMMDA